MPSLRTPASILRTNEAKLLILEQNKELKQEEQPNEWLLFFFYPAPFINHGFLSKFANHILNGIICKKSKYE
jgi:hypothetical protein